MIVHVSECSPFGFYVHIMKLCLLIHILKTGMSMFIRVLLRSDTVFWRHYCVIHVRIGRLFDIVQFYHIKV